LNVRTRALLARGLLFSPIALVLLLAASLSGQNPGSALVVMGRDLRRALPITVTNGQEMLALDDLASTFQLVVREERDALTVSYKSQTVVLTADQAMASVSGRLISLPAPPIRLAGKWLVPIDFISRALLPIYDQRLELRRPAHLLIVGDLRVPRVTVRSEQIGLSARVTVESTPRAAPSLTQDGNQRLTVKFDADAIDVALPSDVVPGFIQGYRSVDATSFAIDLGPRFGLVRTSTQIVDASTRLILELLPSATDNAPLPPASAPASSPQQGEPAPPELPDIRTTSQLRTLAIDAGHGGDDVGAKGAGGTTEKDLTLAIARRLKAAVEARLGLRVIMTREDDRSVPATDRSALANNNKANLFVSLHANASFRSEVSGATVYVASFDQAATNLATLRPERLPAFGGGQRDLELVPWNLAQIRYRDQSDVLAQFVTESFRDRVPLGPRPFEHAPLRVLESANMPAVLVEVGYLSNAAQEKRIASPDFQQSLVEALLDAIVRFRDAVSGAEADPR